MLSQLQIRNFVLIEELSVGFAAGFNVITGETGAGKSLIVTSLDLLLGKRATGTLVRKGCDEAEVIGIFDIKDEPDIQKRLEAAGFPVDDELMIQRKISASGKNRCFVNGRLCALGLLAELTGGIAQVMSQHEQYSLFDPKTQRALLDGFGHNDKKLKEMAHLMSDYRAATRHFEELSTSSDNRAARLDYLQFQLEEFDNMAPAPNEVSELEAEIKLLQHQADLLETTERAAYDLYEGDQSIFERLGKLSNALESLSEVDPTLTDEARQLQEATLLVEESARAISRYHRSLDADPSRLDEVIERRDNLMMLARKHRVDPDELPALGEKLRTELAGLTDFDNALSTAATNRDRTLDLARKAAGKLHQKRSAQATTLGKKITAELKGLALGSGRFQVHLSYDEQQLSELGADRVDFQVELNKGEGVHSLKQVASGGELSRIMLAIKHVLAGVGPLGTYVFDEIDSGIGGNVANAVAQKLIDVAGHHQIICISHLPQIAAAAHTHFHISKTAHKGRTATLVDELSDDERLSELARMLGGDGTSDSMLAAARELRNATGTAGKRT